MVRFGAVMYGSLGHGMVGILGLGVSGGVRRGLVR